MYVESRKMAQMKPFAGQEERHRRGERLWALGAGGRVSRETGIDMHTPCELNLPYSAGRPEQCSGMARRGGRVGRETR